MNSFTRKRASVLTELPDERGTTVVNVLAGIEDVVAAGTLDNELSSRPSNGSSEHASNSTEECDSGESEFGEEHV